MSIWVGATSITAWSQSATDTGVGKPCEQPVERHTRRSADQALPIRGTC